MSDLHKSGCTLVTGAGGALGGAVARTLAARGRSLALLDTPHGKERLEALRDELARGGAKVATYTDAVTSAETWSALVARVTADVAAIDGAVLVAGGWRGGAPLHAEANDETWSAMIGSNLDTVHGALRAVLPAMVAAKHGSIVVIGSRNVERPWTGAGAAAYTASKAAAVALAQAVAAEVVDYGVRVNAILPSTMDTPANRRAMPNADPTRWVATESAAAVIAFLLSEDARDVSGAAIPVYGRA